jgi:imidazolonepropionase-like amidohydrolase
MLKMTGQIGEILEGAFADLIVLDKNPLEDVTILDKGGVHLKAVLKGGYVYRSSLNKLRIDLET